MIDRTLPHHGLFMVHSNLHGTPAIELPSGYRLTQFSGEHDIQDWVNIELSSGDVLTENKAHDAFDRYFGGRLEEIQTQMFFAVDEATGTKVGTATGGTRVCPFSASLGAELQWVAVRSDFQGKGLAKPLVSAAMRRMSQAGHAAAWLSTQTRSWLACKIYQQLGWRRHPGTNPVGYEKGWPIVDDEIQKLRLTRSP